MGNKRMRVLLKTMTLPQIDWMNIIFAPPSGNVRFAPVEELRTASRTPNRATDGQGGLTRDWTSR